MWRNEEENITFAHQQNGHDGVNDSQKVFWGKDNNLEKKHTHLPYAAQMINGLS